MADDMDTGTDSLAQQSFEGWEDDDDEDAGLYALPPGEEGMLHSHAGEVIVQQIMEGIDPRCVHYPRVDITFSIATPTYRKRGDPRTCKNCIQECINAWRNQLPWLVSAYLSWKHGNAYSDGSTPYSVGSDADASTKPAFQGDLAWQIVTLDFEGMYH
jgi:hypothetical protein